MHAITGAHLTTYRRLVLLPDLRNVCLSVYLVLWGLYKRLLLRIRGFLNDMRYINSRRFHVLLTRCCCCYCCCCCLVYCYYFDYFLSSQFFQLRLYPSEVKFVEVLDLSIGRMPFPSPSAKVPKELQTTILRKTAYSALVAFTPMNPA